MKEVFVCPRTSSSRPKLLSPCPPTVDLCSRALIGLNKVIADVINPTFVAADVPLLEVAPQKVPALAEQAIVPTLADKAIESTVEKAENQDTAGAG